MGIKSPLSFVQIAIVAIGFFGAGCGDDSPTGSSVPRFPKFYFKDAGNPDQIHVYDVKADSVKTIVLPSGVFSANAGFGPLAASSRLRRLYLGDFYQGYARTGVYDLDSDSLIDVRPIASYYGIAASPDDRLLALCGDSLIVVRSSDFSVVFHDSAQASRPVFSRDSRTLYAVEGKTGQFAFIVHFLSNSVDCQKHAFPTPIWRILPSPDEKHWFIYVILPGNLQAVGVYDPVKDSLVASTTTSPGFGDLECTPDGGNLIYSSPGGEMIFGPNPFGFFVVDLTRGFRQTKVSTNPLIDQSDSTLYYFRPAEMALSSDGHYLAAAPGDIVGAFVVYDVWTSRFLRTWNYNRVDPRAVFVSVVCVY